MQAPGLKAEYFDDDALQTLVTQRIDAQVDFEWEYGIPPGTAISNYDTFSVRWTGTLTAPVTGLYTFTTSTDDGVRLWVGGQSVINNWTLQNDYDPLSTGTASLVAGQSYPLVMEYFEGPGLAHARLSWAYPGQALQVVPASALSHEDGPTVPGVPPLVETGTGTDFSDATSFLYTGSNPPQTGVVPGTIVPSRVAVAHGRVVNRAGAPLSGVKVTALSHPEWGETLTRSDGAYEFAFNGGGVVTLNFEKAGLLPVQRPVKSQWRDWVAVEEVALTALDSAVTVVSANAPALQVARGSAVTDEDGARRATLLVPANTGVTLTLPGGGTQALSSMSVRATEYTVGRDGPKAMPGALPPMSGYTYAVEWSLDEALAAGATRVSFSRPVYFYLENFLAFPVGGAVPTGYYNRQLGAWQADLDGRVVKVVAINGGLADVDVTGDGVADTGPALSDLGFTNDERQRLATLYTAGTSLWRVPLTHLTPWDCNWPFGFPDDATEPPDDAPEGDEPEPNSCTTSGSIIECENQTLGEALPVTGTPYTLNYRSDRVPGRTSRYSFEVPLTGASVPTSLKAVVLRISGAGRTWNYRFAKTPNQRFTFHWDGRDLWGRKLHGTQKFYVDVGYAYQGVYRTPGSGGGAGGGRSFGAGGGARMATGDRIAIEVFLWRRWAQRLVAHDALALALGGWTLNAHHTFEPTTGMLHRGDGTRQSAQAVDPVWKLVAGSGQGGVADGGIATQSSFTVNQLNAGPDGSLYAVESQGGIVRRISPDGRVYTSIGCKSGCAVTDGGVGAPATSTDFGTIWVHALGPDGSHYVSTNNNRIYRITPDGIVHPFAGNGASPNVATNGEGGPATQASIGSVGFIQVSSEGDVYFSTAYNDYPDRRRIRRVDTNGIITTVVGDGTNLKSATPVPALSTGIGDQTHAAAFDSEGALYFTGQTDYRIRRLDADGLVRSVVGTGVKGYLGDDGPADIAGIGDFIHRNGLAVGPDGSLYFTDASRVRRVGPDGIVSTVAGTGVYGSRHPVEGASALQTDLYPNPAHLAVTPDGALHIVFNAPNRIYKLSSPSSAFGLDERLVPSEDGREAYVFSGGRHMRTLDALTGATLLTFGYDTAGRLVTLTDANAQVTTIERQSDGRPTAILAPGGQRTELTVTPEGLLTRVENPNNEAVVLAYGVGGLLTKLTDPGNGEHDFEYDSTGRLVYDSNPGGGFKTLTRSKPLSGSGAGKAGFAVDVMTAEGRVTRHTSEWVGSKQRRTTRTPAGFTTIRDLGVNGVDVTTYPDGTVENVRAGSDLRLGAGTPLTVSYSAALPSGLTRVATASQSLTRPSGANALDPFAYTTQTWTSVLNGKSSSLEFAKATGRFTHTSPMGKKVYTDIDAKGRVARFEVTGLTPVTYAYYPDGQLASVTQGVRTQAFAYHASGGAKGWLASTTDALNRTASFTQDGVGRVTDASLPGPRALSLDYDAEGNLTSLTPPGKPPHAFGYSANDQEDVYTPPAVTGMGTLSTVAAYNLDDQPTLVSFPDSTSASVTYDTGGRLATVTAPRHTVTAGYSPTTGHLESLTDSAAASGSGASLAFTRDGPLVTGVSWTGGVSGNVGYTYNTHFDVASVSVNGGTPIAYTYDNDRLLSAAGSLTTTRNASNGLLTGTTLGSVTTTQGYNLFGEVASLAARYGTAPLYSVTLTRDNLGRITSRAEAVQGGATQTWGYTYDTAGRLETVTLNGVAHASYGYDANGNRTLQTEAGVVTAATHDDQDRLLTLGTASYTWGPRGDLRTKTVGTDVTQYTYDTAGNLTAVALPGGTEVAYVIDAANRRIGKRVNGSLTQGFLYDGQLRVVAELDGAGSVVSRFVYGTRGHSPDFMVKGGVTYRFVSDHLGSPRLVVNTANGNVAQALEYDAWGRVLADSNPGFQPFGFAGGLFDRDTKLTRFGARDYDAEAGRWTTKDPIRFAGGDTNLYVYVGNQPIGFIDPQGTLMMDPSLGVVNEHGLQNFVGFVWGTAGQLAGWLMGSPVTKRVEKSKFGDILIFENHPFQNGYATTYGRVICATSKNMSPSTFDHEMQHVEQSQVLGPLYLPAHLALQTYSRLTTGSYSAANPLEAGPHSNPPRPWP
ncbi:PA14 domain-containing protein [Pyxidicoccus xibeiensis]|uniref:PA14 domain-containing protein n=1 Tax=Pyxidicoccus xibeiensis TaxID=2906759 RepID=UPI0020A76BC9|nr:PA14 domain-containing protein [Pyxidicoccus xibeiensis]MCP3142346.1 PA14 domain-containing protein [Pyxidicoccus xibeiensis]